MRGRLVAPLVVLVLLILLPAYGLPTPIVAAPAGQDGEGGPRIDAPAGGSRVSGQVEIRGRAHTQDPTRFQFYRLYYGQGAEASTLRPIAASVDRPVEDGVLGTWDVATVTPGEYLILLTVYDTGGRTTNARVVVTVEPPPTPLVRPTMAPLVVVTPGEVPTPGPEEEAPPATPIPELPQLDPNIPRFDIPPPAPPPAIPNVAPVGPEQGAQPVQPSGPASAPPPVFPQPQAPSSAPPPLDPIVAPSNPSSAPGSSGAPSINAPAPPPPPPVQPYVPPPPLPTVAPPTPFGIPPT